MILMALKIDNNNLQFLQTEDKRPLETEAQFKVRRLFEELSFCGGLDSSSKIELVNRARIITRMVTQLSVSNLGDHSPLKYLPHNVFCISGIFGLANTSFLTRSLSGAKTDAAFTTAFDKHLSELILVANELLVKEEHLEHLAMATYRCANGLEVFLQQYSFNQPLQRAIHLQINEFRKIQKKCIQADEALPLNGSILETVQGQEILIPSLKNIMTQWKRDAGHIFAKQVTEEHIKHFVSNFLHQFITGQITSKNCPFKRTPLITLLLEQINSLKMETPPDLELIAVKCYCDVAAQGYFTANREPDISALHTAIQQALAIDFPYLQLPPNELHVIVIQSFKTARVIKFQLEEEIKNQRPLDLKMPSRQERLATLEANNRSKNKIAQSWFF